jgi:beta-glucosidase/6-phospho-beta-glucosidase/beta-galactosidase
MAAWSGLLQGSVPPGFVFATGIECSYPTVVDTQGRRVRIDQLEKSFHYRYWQTDLALVRELGIHWLRYGPPYYAIDKGAGNYDWEFTDLVLAEMQRIDIVPIIDLCHFGVPDWIGDFQNPEWPNLFADYASAFANRYPWVRFYTPVNEIYVCAKLSARAGFWNERAKSDLAFVTAMKHLCRANLLAVEAILKVRQDAVFIQSESAEYFHLGASDPDTVARAAWENRIRFLSFDLLYSVPPDGDVLLYLLDNGLTREEFHWFMNHKLGDRIVMGNDFYERNEQLLYPGGEIRPAGEVFGWSVITRQYFERYRRPVMHTETNNIGRSAAEAPRWLWKEFLNVRNLREQGVPVIGFTWFSLTDQVDWDSALILQRGVVNPIGLYDLQRQPRPVARAYAELIREFNLEPLLPYGTVLGFGEQQRCGHRSRYGTEPTRLFNAPPDRGPD